MASIGHIAIGVAAGRHVRSQQVSKKQWLLATALLCFLSFSPDLDVVGFSMGVPYLALWGHRGASHSFVFAVLIGLAAAGLFRRQLGVSYWRLAVLCILAMASHGVLDAMTTGGEGIGFLWPFSHERFFLPLRFIPVSHIGLRVTSRQMVIFAVEVFLFLPFFIYGLRSPKQAVETGEGI